MTSTDLPAGQHEPATPTDLKAAALEYAKRGLAVFPLVPGDKVPAIPKREGGCGVHDATTDPAKIAEWWTRWPKANIGFHVGAADLMAVDFDPLDDDDTPDQISARADAFAGDHDLPETWTARTPRGGLHEYYAVSTRIPPSTSKIAAGVDVRSDGSYTLLPPSSTADGAYSWIDHADPAPATASLIKAATEGARKKDPAPDKINVAEDQPENIGEYIDWLKHTAKVPKRGQRNNMLAATAAMGKSHAVSADKTVELIKLYWNPRLDEPLDDDEIDISGPSGHRSGTSAQGNMTKEYHLSKAGSVFTDRTENANDTPHKFQPLDVDEQDAIEPPPWLIHNVLVRESYAMLFGPPGSYKTFLAMDMALCIANGNGTWFNEAAINTGDDPRVLLVVGEGQGNISRRRRAWEQYWNKGNCTPRGRFFVLNNMPLLRGGYDQFAEGILRASDRYDLIIIDTLARTMSGMNENSTEHVSLMTEAADMLRREFGATTLTLHHSGLEGGRERGSSGLRGDLDTVLMLDDSRLSIVKQKDGEERENWLILKPKKVGGSLVLDIPSELEKKADELKWKNALPSAEKKERADHTAQLGSALKADPLIAKILSKAPIGGSMGRDQAAQFIYSHDLNGGRFTLGTLKRYLTLLSGAPESITRENFHQSGARSKWVNRGDALKDAA